MRNGFKVTLGVLTIMILITITIGTSYSYYSISDVQKDPNELVTTCFNVSYKDDNGSSAIALNTPGNYAYPMSEAKALANLKPYTFTLTNNCTSANATSGVNYVITLNTLTASPSNLTGYLKYKLNTTAPSPITGPTGSLKTPYNLNPSIVSSEGIDTSYSIESGVLAPGTSKTFNLYLWIDENAGNEVMDYDFTGKVLVYSYM